ADPYGHLLVVTGWVPQGATEPGLLMAADAQPDGTIGRRRFWQGSFLFTPDTRDVGAGFKGWRPVYAEKGGAVVARDNAYLQETRNFPPYSEDQYAGSASDFYDRMEALMNPRPLDPFARQAALVEALHEVVKRRVQAVDNGEAFMRERAHRPIDMPDGANIFLTAGPWEDFSTPSRDLRLLISIHTVLDFADSVRRNPARFDLAAAEAEGVVAQVAAARDVALGERTVQYTNSAGQPVTLTLAQVVARRHALEMAYNPNDCAEIRWGAVAGTDEYASCQRHAPQAHRDRMAEYRSWFAERRRPAR
ncbi:MAG: hypothetical protein KC613_14355, partial [Myxococcales bacterium]|nr:hypothetical protein [Myxococcales bacterium]